MNEKNEKGLIIVNTGDGKGKTTAALGTVFRALGYDYKVCMVQFIKGSWHYGELDAAKKFSENFEFLPMGEGFTWETKDKKRDTLVAQRTWELCKEKILSEKYKIVILDEINIAFRYNYLNVKEVVNFLKNKPEDLHIILTGRNAPPEIIEIADLVTEMKEIKHPFKSGVKAQKGIEY
ncbi:MAG: cob(I)yrinic acid a,c-diamide adenosyltransferase [Nitrospinota bacterium]